MTPRDHKIKLAIHEFGPLTIDHLIALAEKEDLGSPDTLWRRLRHGKPLLKDGVYVKQRSLSEKYVYATYNIRRRKDFDHDLMVTSILTILHVHFDLKSYSRPKQKFRNRVNEDLYAVLGLPTGTVHYFIEADIGSEGYDQIADKVKRYLSRYDPQKPFLVLFVTQDERRVKDLCRRLEPTVPRGRRRMFLFTTLDQLTSNPEGPVCRITHDPTTPYFLLPKLPQDSPGRA
jgi:hypothetical protein